MKKLFSIFSLLIVCVCAMSQSKSLFDKNIVIQAGGGIGSMLVNCGDSLIPRVGLGYNISAMYQQRVGAIYLEGGIGISYLSSSMYADKMNFAQSEHLLPGANFSGVLLTEFNQWTEYQKQLRFDIPIAIGYKTELARKPLMLNAGLKFSIPISSQYSVSGGGFSRSYFIPSLDVTLEDLPSHYLTTYDASVIENGKFESKPSLSITFDAEIDVWQSDIISLGIGVYGEYGISSSRGIKDVESLDNTNPPVNSAYDYSGLFNSNLVSGFHSIEAGIKMQLKIGVAKKPKEQKEPSSVIRQEESEYIKSAKREAQDIYNRYDNGHDKIDPKYEDNIDAAKKVAKERAGRE